MGLRRRSIRLRIFLLVVIPILALVGLYAFAASTTASAALVLARARTVKNVTGVPTGTLETAVDAERLLAVVYLAAPVPQNLAALHAAEVKTDRARAAFSASVSSGSTLSSASPGERQAIKAMLTGTGSTVLGALRTQVTSRAIGRLKALNAYGGLIADADDVLNQLILQETNIPIVAQGLTLVRLGNSEQILLEEDALLTGDLATRTFSPADQQEFAELAGARRTILTLTLAELEPGYRAIYYNSVSPQTSAAVTALENKVITDPHPHVVPPVSLASWNKAVETVSAEMAKSSLQTADELTLRAQPLATAVFLRLFIVAGLGLLAVLLSIFMSIWIGRGLLRQLAGLRESALDLANDRLPNVIGRLRAGEDVDVTAEAPPLDPLASDGDEIGQVRQAFNAVQRTAIEAAVDEARLRRGISDVFRNLARRSQSLLHRQLALLDGMERRASGPEELEDLFRIDHLTTRMRRHAEGLIILSGESPGRGWRNPVPLVDVLRAAVAEVEDYTRIRVVSRTQAALTGPAVADVIHLIAELAENATIYSPPNTPVRIMGDVVGRGFAVEIEDRGLGISDTKRTEINANLASPPQFDLSGSDRLGLFIAGQLARRHDIKVTLRPSPYGGTTAVVLIPNELVVDGRAAGSPELAGPDGERAIRLTGRHAALSQGDDSLPGAGPAIAGQRSPAGLVPAAQPADDVVITAGPADSAFATASPPDDVFTTARPSTDVFAAVPPSGPDASASRALQPDRVWRRAGEPASEDNRPPSASSPRTAENTAALGLPVRVRQASLAPQLRDSTGPAGNGGAGPAPGALSPEAARSTMAAMQKGWERGRSASGTAAPDAVPDADGEPVTGELSLDGTDE